jgi:ATP-dependent helicase/nuclease subunit B
MPALTGALKMEIPLGVLWPQDQAEWLKAVMAKAPACGLRVETFLSAAAALPEGDPAGLDRLARVPDQPAKDTPLAWLFKPDEALMPVPGLPQIHFFSASSPSAELRAGLRWALRDQNRKLDEIQILATDAATYGIAARAMQAESGLAFTFGMSLPWPGTRPSEGVEALLAWLESGGNALGLALALRQGHLAVPENVGAKSYELAAALENRGIGYGLDRYQPTFLSQLELGWKLEWTGDQERGDDDKNETRLRQDFVWLTEACKSLLNGLSGKIKTISPGQVAAWLRGLFSDWIPKPANESEGTERTSLARAIRNLAECCRNSAVMPLKEAVDVVREHLRALEQPSHMPEPGKVYIGDLGRGGTGRPVTILVGFDEGRFPSGLKPDAFLEPIERKTLGLPEAADFARQRLAIGLQALAELGQPEALALGFCRFDVVDNREQSPSSAALQFFRLSHDRKAGYKDFLKHVGSPEGLGADNEALAEWEVMLAQRRNGAPLEAFKLFLPVRQWTGLQAAAWRQADKFGPLDGELQRSIPGHQPLTKGDGPFSFSRMERLADCPRAYLFEKILKLHPIDTGIEFEANWLDLAQEGNLLHQFYAWYCGEWKKADRPSKAGAERKMDELLAQAALMHPATHPDVIKTTSLRLKKEAVEFDRFMRNISDETAKPYEVEFSLGVDSPMLLPLGSDGNLSFKGYADIIMASPEGLQVYDFKTGSTKLYNGKTFKLAQIHLYVAAVSIEMRRLGRKEKVVQTGYLFTTQRGRYQNITEDTTEAKSIAVVHEMIGDVLKGLEQGDLRVNAKTECKYCECSLACDARFAKKKRAEIDTLSAAPNPKGKKK